MNRLVSVIIPARNENRLIRRTLDHVLRAAQNVGSEQCDVIRDPRHRERRPDRQASPTGKPIPNLDRKCLFEAATIRRRDFIH